MTTTDQDGIVRTTRSADGVPVLWTPVPGDTFGGLVVGVGARDVTPATTGIHHLVEHLVMARVGPVVVEHNAESSLDSLVFWASGRTDAVVGFLGRVGAAIAALGDVTDEEVDLQRATIRRELGLPGMYAAAGPLSARFGAAGLGLADVEHAALPAITAADVHAFAARWMVAGNARVVLTTEPPQDLAVGMPLGDAPARPAHPAPVDGPLPGLVVTPAGRGASLSFLVGGTPAARMVTGTLVEEVLTRRLRHADGAVYSVALASWWVDATTSAWVVGMDPEEQRAGRVLLDAYRTLLGVAADGPDDDVLAHARAVLLEQMGSVDGHRGLLALNAEADLRGVPRPPDLATEVADAAAVTREQVRALLEDALARVILVVPADGFDDETATAFEDLGVTYRHMYPAFEGSPRELMRNLMSGGTATRGLLSAALSEAGSVHPGRFFGPRRGEEIWLGPRQLALPSLAAHVTVEDVVLAGEDDDGDVELVTRTGGTVLLNPAHFRRAATPWARFMSALPPEVVRHKRGVGVGRERA
ncbi:insulinase family protein [Cellulomonas fimi]|uniref:Peptidase M16 domain protein n=1 Tax=Cellulomonas fimi (strain ATCC 484 / DSM 20113 / JCM 1341 / CCUG 24087 / LMG 16345 / NBRC 15513 / NCIMB 8980 / NCTC 7547 / NRS-133) TaxID=590998 RepID=F4H6K2_CELFA|nr:insulinase family protein [Cellulomonas fimi]AEE45635.1 peptidase M16 domain protein [Cellulomonas fimi ATCC 484]NNH08071.1 insulinase family protein [Cellulomonas fimi]VEH30135.1 Uncharacterised protein [Cellulomonas fimi]